MALFVFMLYKIISQTVWSDDWQVLHIHFMLTGGTLSVFRYRIEYPAWRASPHFNQASQAECNWFWQWVE